MQPVGWFAILWRAGAVLALLLGLLLLAVSARSQSPEGVAGLFGFSLFVSVGFLLFGRQRFRPIAESPPSEDERLA